MVPGKKGWTFARDQPAAVVRGTFVNRMPPKDKGWSEVHMAFDAGGELTENQKMFAAGALEGAMTAQGIKDFFLNTKLGAEVRNGFEGMFMPQMGYLGENV